MNGTIKDYADGIRGYTRECGGEIMFTDEGGNIEGYVRDRWGENVITGQVGTIIGYISNRGVSAIEQGMNCL